MFWKWMNYIQNMWHRNIYENFNADDDDMTNDRLLCILIEVAHSLQNRETMRFFLTLPKCTTMYMQYRQPRHWCIKIECLTFKTRKKTHIFFFDVGCHRTVPFGIFEFVFRWRSDVPKATLIFSKLSHFTHNWENKLHSYVDMEIRMCTDAFDNKQSWRVFFFFLSPNFFFLHLSHNKWCARDFMENGKSRDKNGRKLKYSTSLFQPLDKCFAFHVTGYGYNRLSLFNAKWLTEMRLRGKENKFALW